MTKIISLDELLDKEALEEKEYFVVNHYTYHACVAPKYLIRVKIQAKGVEGKRTVIGKTALEYPSHGTICLDEEGLPYLEKVIDSLVHHSYDEILLHNTDFGSSMANLNGKLIGKILKMTKNQNHPVYQMFKTYIKSLIEKAPKIWEAKLQKHYYGKKQALRKISRLDLEIFDLLALHQDNYFDYDFDNDKDNPEYYEDHIELTSANERSAFIFWYQDFMVSHGFENKMEAKRSDKVRDRLLKQATKKITTKLEHKGFKKVKHFTNN